MENKIFRILGILVVAVAVFAGVAVMADDGNISLPRGQEISTDYINAGDTVDVASDVRGDVIVAGSDVIFSGNADGDVLMGAANARINGNSGGDVRAAAGSVSVGGTVAKNVTVAGGNIVIEEGSAISGNLHAAGGRVEIRGNVQGNVTVYASEIVFSGRIGGNADFNANNITVRQDASIAGNLTYASNAELVPAKGVVAGTVTRVPMETPTDNYAATAKAATAGVVIWQFLALLVIVLLLERFFARQVRELAAPITSSEIWGRIATGFLWLVLNPILIAVAIISIIGLPLALVILFFYIVLIIIAYAITPILLGALANRKLKLYAGGDKDIWKDFILGYVLMQIIALVPILGGLFIFFLFLFAFGRVGKYVFEMFKRNR